MDWKIKMTKYLKRLPEADFNSESVTIDCHTKMSIITAKINMLTAWFQSL